MLLGSKLLKSGHNVHLIGVKDEVDLINSDGIYVSIPDRKSKEDILLHSKSLYGKLTASTPENINVSNFQIVFLAMQEFQYKEKELKKSILEIAKLKIPTVSIMNIPPHAFLKNFSKIELADCREAYQSLEIWDNFDPKFLSTASPDAQAFRPKNKNLNFLQVRLASNFKISEFSDQPSNEILYQLEKNIKLLRIPVYIVIEQSKFVAMTKWPMLICGNYRCVEKDKIISIKDAVLQDEKTSEKIYNDVTKLCIMLGAEESLMVPFKHYFRRVPKLDAPSSVARMIESKKMNIERFDKLLKIISEKNNIEISDLEKIVSIIDSRLEKNRKC